MRASLQCVRHTPTRTRIWTHTHTHSRTYMHTRVQTDGRTDTGTDSEHHRRTSQRGSQPPLLPPSCLAADGWVSFRPREAALSRTHPFMPSSSAVRASSFLHPPRGGEWGRAVEIFCPLCCLSAPPHLPAVWRMGTLPGLMTCAYNNVHWPPASGGGSVAFLLASSLTFYHPTGWSVFPQRSECSLGATLWSPLRPYFSPLAVLFRPRRSALSYILLFLAVYHIVAVRLWRRRARMCVCARVCVVWMTML